MGQPGSADDRSGKDILAWARRHGEPRTAGVAGTGGYGYRLAAALAGEGVEVFEVNRPDRSRRRRNGKSDPADAEAAARAVLAAEARPVPKDREGPVGSLRALVVARRSAVKRRGPRRFNQIHALLVGCDDTMRKILAPLRDRELAGACARLRPTDGLRGPGRPSSRPKLACFEWIEGFYNRIRRHSFLGQLNPAEYERR